MDAHINAKVPKLNKEGTLHAVRLVSCTGQVTYQKVDAGGTKSRHNA